MDACVHVPLDKMYDCVGCISLVSRELNSNDRVHKSTYSQIRIHIRSKVLSRQRLDCSACYIVCRNIRFRALNEIWNLLRNTLGSDGSSSTNVIQSSIYKLDDIRKWIEQKLLSTCIQFHFGEDISHILVQHSTSCCHYILHALLWFLFWRRDNGLDFP